jgi:diguanylate cyclase (GGDEF)-like protein/PAS domain S-box-containing protein
MGSTDTGGLHGIDDTVVIKALSKPTRRAGVFIAIIALTGLMLTFGNLPQRWDLVIYDAHASLFLREAHPDIRIVAIDEPSIDLLGRWPWPRSVHSKLIQKLSAAGARAIGLDILFTEPDLQDPESDQRMADAIASSGRVVLPLYPGKDLRKNQLTEVLPLPIFTRAAAMLGHVDAELDVDGVSRSVFLKAGTGSPHWSVLPLAMLQLDQADDWKMLPGQQRNPVKPSAADGTWLRNYRILVPFAGPPEHFETLSYVDVLNRPVDELALQGKWVLVGVTAIGLGDQLATPTSKQDHQMSGVEYNANVLDTLLNGIAIRPVETRTNVALTLLLLGLTLLLFFKLPSGGSLPAWILMLLTTFVITAVTLVQFHLWFAPATALVLIGLSYPLWLWGSLGDYIAHSQTERERTQASYDALMQGMVVTDPECRIEYMSAAAEQLTGYSLDQIRGQRFTDAINMLDDGGNGPFNSGCDVPEGVTRPTCYQLARRGGESQLVWLNARSIQDKKGYQRGWIITLRESGKDCAALNHADDAFYFDALTGLPNRSLLVAQLKQVLRRADRTTGGVALLFITLYRFRQIIDRLDYKEGDQLLRKVAERLQSGVRESDILARNGSEQFVIVLEDVASREAAASVAGKMLEQLSAPYPVAGHEVEVTVRIGISLYPGDGQEPEVLLKNAYEALPGKQLRDDQQFRFFSKELHEQVKERQTIEHRLPQALVNNEYQLHYQPQIEISTGRIVGAEVLLRWRNADGDSISPTDFIPIAEELGLIHEIGEWVFSSACRQLRRWKAEGMGPLRLSINVSPIQLDRRRVISGFLGLLKENRLDPGCFDLEVTEGEIMRNIDHSIELLRQFQLGGGSISVDDFGTGYSTFGYLKQLPINRLKIDKSLVRDVASFQDDATITLTIISMAHRLNLEVVAEGVETPEQMDLLRDQGCDLVQGYLIAKPLPANDFSAFVKGWSKSSQRSGMMM